MLVNKEEAIKKKFSAALMSNEKWKKFYKVLIDLPIKYGRLEYKFTFDRKIYFGSSPSHEK